MTAVLFPCTCKKCLDFRYAIETERLRAEEYKSDLHNGDYDEEVFTWREL